MSHILAQTDTNNDLPFQDKDIDILRKPAFFTLTSYNYRNFHVYRANLVSIQHSACALSLNTCYQINFSYVSQSSRERMVYHRAKPFFVASTNSEKKSCDLRDTFLRYNVPYVTLLFFRIGKCYKKMVLHHGKQFVMEGIKATTKLIKM